MCRCTVLAVSSVVLNRALPFCTYQKWQSFFFSNPLFFFFFFYYFSNTLDDVGDHRLQDSFSPVSLTP